MSPLTGFLDRFRKDLLYGLRILRSKPGFTAVALLSIALGIGATAAIFSVVYAVLIDPYPYRAADRIGQVVLTSKKDPRWGIEYTKVQYAELKSRLRSMEEPVAIDRQETVMTGSSLAEVVVRARCSPNFFEFFGVSPLFGREFAAGNHTSNAAPEPIAVISFQFWQRSSMEGAISSAINCGSTWPTFRTRAERRCRNANPSAENTPRADPAIHARRGKPGCLWK